MGRKTNDLVNAMVEAIEKATKKRTSGYDTSATVKRIEGNTAWVHIPGGVDETPVKLTVASKVGDTVQVRVSGGKAFIIGNATAPPTDDTTALVSRAIATEAKYTADTALNDAERAKTAADSAVESAGIAGRAASVAQTAAEAAQATADSKKTVFVTQPTPPYHVGDLWARLDADLEDFVDSNGNSIIDDQGALFQAAILRDAAAWVCLVPKLEGQTFDEADWELTTADTNLREWFWHDANGAHVLGDATGYRNDIDSTGMHIVDTTDESALAEFGATGAVIGKNGESRVFIDTGSFQIIDADGIQQFVASKTGSTKTDNVSRSYSLDIGLSTNPVIEIPSGTSVTYLIRNLSTNSQIATGTFTASVGSVYSDPSYGSISISATNASSTTFAIECGSAVAERFVFIWSKTFDIPLIETIGDCSVGNDFYVDSSKLIDFVIEQGKVVDTNWRYRKWKSGFKEAWHEGNVTASATTAVTIGGNTVQYRSTWSLDIPNTIFNDPPTVNIGLGASGQVRFGINGNATSRTALEGYVFRNTASSATYNVAASIYAWGY